MIIHEEDERTLLQAPTKDREMVPRVVAEVQNGPKYMKGRPAGRSPSGCSVYLEPRKSSCWFSKLRYVISLDGGSARQKWSAEDHNKWIDVKNILNMVTPPDPILFCFNLRLPTLGIDNLPLYGAHDDPSGLPFIGNNEMETEVGPSTIRIPDLIIRRPILPT